MGISAEWVWRVVLYRYCSGPETLVLLARTTTQVQGGQQVTMVMRDMCPVCGSQQFKKNGHIHHGKQNHRCKACGRQFVEHAEGCVIPEEQRTLVQCLLRENIS
jgi:transposase-like protein